jgi:hypothetical protein
MKTDMSLRELEDAGNTVNCIYVLNNTKGVERGNVVFTVPKSIGMGLDNVLIPATFIPIDLQDQVSKKQLLESSEFRRSLSTRRLRLITNEYATSLLNEEGAEEERDRLFNETQAIMNQVQSPEDMVTGDMIDPSVAKVKTSETAGVDEGEEINQGVISILDRLKDNNDEIGALNSLKSLGELSKGDYNYVVRTVNPKYNRIRHWASEFLKPSKK